MSIPRALVNAAVKVLQTAPLDHGTPAFDLSLGASAVFTDGAGLNQVNRLFSDQRTLAASASESLDLAGSLTDAFGATITFAKVKAILVKAAEDNTNNVVVGGANSNAFTGPFGSGTDTISIPPGGFALLVAPTAAGWSVTASTADLLKVANSGGTTSVTYDIVILGAA